MLTVYICFSTSLQKGKEKSHGKGRTETWTIEFIPKEASKFENYASCGPEKNINESKRNIVGVTTTVVFGKQFCCTYHIPYRRDCSFWYAYKQTISFPRNTQYKNAQHVGRTHVLLSCKILNRHIMISFLSEYLCSRKYFLFLVIWHQLDIYLQGMSSSMQHWYCTIYPGLVF